MSHQIRKSLVHLSVWAVLCISTLPAIAQAPASGSASGAGWTSANWTALITAISSIVVAMIAALKGTAAQSKADSNEERLHAVSDRLNLHGHQITTLALNQTPPVPESRMEMPPLAKGKDQPR